MAGELLPRILPPASLEALAAAHAGELSARAGQLSRLRLSSVERAALLAQNLERAYTAGILAGWRLAWNHLHPKGTAPDGTTR